MKALQIFINKELQPREKKKEKRRNKLLEL